METATAGWYATQVRACTDISYDERRQLDQAHFAATKAAATARLIEEGETSDLVRRMRYQLAVMRITGALRDEELGALRTAFLTEFAPEAFAVAVLKAREFENHEPVDRDWEPRTRPKDDPSYRAAMIDAGRGRQPMRAQYLFLHDAMARPVDAIGPTPTSVPAIAPLDFTAIATLVSAVRTLQDQVVALQHQVVALQQKVKNLELSL